MGAKTGAVTAVQRASWPGFALAPLPARDQRALPRFHTIHYAGSSPPRARGVRGLSHRCPRPRMVSNPRRGCSKSGYRPWAELLQRTFGWTWPKARLRASHLPQLPRADEATHRGEEPCRHRPLSGRGRRADRFARTGSGAKRARLLPNYAPPTCTPHRGRANALADRVRFAYAPLVGIGRGMRLGMALRGSRFSSLGRRAAEPGQILVGSGDQCEWVERDRIEPEYCACLFRLRRRTRA